MNNQDVWDEFHTCRLKWLKLRAPSRMDFEHLLVKSTSLKETTSVLETRRPDCSKFSGKVALYEVQFSKFCTDVKAKLRENDLAQNQLNTLLFAKEGIDDLEATINTLVRIREENWRSLTGQTADYSAWVLSRLDGLRSEMKKANRGLLVDLEKVRDGLDRNHSRLRELLEPTHEWVKSTDKKRCTKCLEETEIPSEKTHTIYDEPEKEYPHYW